MTQAHERGGAWAERRFQNALLLLRDATDFSRDRGRAAWDYCLSLDELVSAGLTVADCRWLADRAYVEARDLKPTRDGRRARPRKATFTKATRFVLTADGVDYAAELYAASAVVRSAQAGRPGAEKHPTGRLRWDSRRRVLSMGDVIVLRVLSKARNQIAIMAAFEALGWPRRIENPLVGRGKARGAQPLIAAVHRLNRNLIAKTIRFHADEKGRSVRYEIPG